MRGCAPLLVAMAACRSSAKASRPRPGLGVAVICAGVVALGLSRSALRDSDARTRKALAFALANAAIIALYTVVDGIGVRASGDALPTWRGCSCSTACPTSLLVLWRRPGRRRAALAYMAGRWKIALLGGAASLGSYGIALWAMTHAPVAVVAALRETSVLFAALIGTLFLREPFGWQRAVGTRSSSRA